MTPKTHDTRTQSERSKKIYIYLRWLTIYIIYCNYHFWKRGRLCPADLITFKKPLIEFETKDFKVFWKETLIQFQKDLLEACCIGIGVELNNIKWKFWAWFSSYTKVIQKSIIKIGCRRRLKKLRKQKKLEKLTYYEYLRKLVSEYFDEHLDLVKFPTDLLEFSYCK